ncbi:alpha/beta hydrolase [Actinomycetospora sp. NBRC 106375]|uniref:alpha/beta fold hydrolase n=1 Tax=Actinomycetospora sp. NBRC 106375 TaxID=3032207 RepID=UPI0024A50635|nr:alpha/beta hydrolase [Actinomycetospora sp. NBRC 106375]GLZ48846.1 alpha/beta hydrolase [Actinomycetospora sp. NBRC 106375]
MTYPTTARPSLVLVHGTGSTGLGSWGPVLDALRQHFTVLAPDLPGSGSAPLPDGPLHLDLLADHVVAAAHDAGIDEFALAGTSLGAAVAVRTATRHPERVRSLALVVGFVRPRPTLDLALRVWAGLAAARAPETGAFLAGLTFAEPYFAALPREAREAIVTAFGTVSGPGVEAQIAAARFVDVAEDLALITVPTLVVSATGDRFVAPEHSHELVQALPHAGLVEMPGGHAAMLEDPGPAGEALVEFLAEQGRSSAPTT